MDALYSFRFNVDELNDNMTEILSLVDDIEEFLMISLVRYPLFDSFFVRELLPSHIQIGLRCSSQDCDIEQFKKDSQKIADEILVTLHEHHGFEKTAKITQSSYVGE